MDANGPEWETARERGSLAKSAKTAQEEPQRNVPLWLDGAVKWRTAQSRNGVGPAGGGGNIVPCDGLGHGIGGLQLTRKVDRHA